MRLERDNRRGGSLLLALLLCGLLTALHARAGRNGHADFVSGLLRDRGVVPAQVAAAHLGEWWHGHFGALLAGPGLSRQNAELQARVLALTAQNKELFSEQAENIRLRGLLGFAQRSPRQMLAAQVIALKPSTLSDTLTLNRGSASGIHPHSIVLAPNGVLVGQVLDVSPGSCDVLLLTDSLSSVGALVHNHTPRGPFGLCQGDGLGHLRVIYLDIDARLHPGDAVTTSGLGGVFPKAVPIGAIDTISVDKARSLQTVILRPSADFNHLEEVFVLLDAVPSQSAAPAAAPTVLAVPSAVAAPPVGTPGT